jgi:hypothetical protein
MEKIDVIFLGFLITIYGVISGIVCHKILNMLLKMLDIQELIAKAIQEKEK